MSDVVDSAKAALVASIVRDTLERVRDLLSNDIQVDDAEAPPKRSRSSLPTAASDCYTSLLP